MLKVILNRLKPQAEKIIAEEQAGFRAGRSTTEQIFNLRILCEKYLQHQQDLSHIVGMRCVDVMYLQYVLCISYASKANNNKKLISPQFIHLRHAKPIVTMEKYSGSQNLL